MDIHEYQAKNLLTRYVEGFLLNGYHASTVEEACDGASSLSTPYVVKAQIHAGGRGKGSFLDLPDSSSGGVRLAHTRGELRQHAQEMLGRRLVTAQTGADGKKVSCLYIEEGCRIAKEFYLSFLVDRSCQMVTIVASEQGGMNIEDVASSSPERIISLPIDPAFGMSGYHIRRLSRIFGLETQQKKDLSSLVFQLYRMFLECDASQIEINPLVITEEGAVRVLDMKCSIDDNALFRQPNLLCLRDSSQEDESESRARDLDISYVKMDGTIGCMVNGAGLAMATMDLIQSKGGQPANFLDVGGSATEEKVSEAFRVILSDPNVRAVLVNIFGGIMRCDVIADGLVAAVRTLGTKVPLVVRLEGTNVDQGKKILSESGLDILASDDIDDGVEQVIRVAKGV